VTGRKKNDAVNYGYVLRLSFVSALGGLLFGFDISVISGAIPFIKEFFQLSEASKGFVVSSLHLGCMVGPRSPASSQIGW